MNAALGCVLTENLHLLCRAALIKANANLVVHRLLDKAAQGLI